MRSIGEEICGEFDTIAKAHRLLGHAMEGALTAGADRLTLAAKLEELRDTVTVAHAAIDQALNQIADTFHLREFLRYPLERAIEATQGARQ